MMDVLRRRFERYGLRLHPDKTHLLPFARPPEDDGNGKGPATFDLLGFTVYWRRTRAGWWRPSLKTRKASFQKAIKAIADWCRRHRHLPVKDQHAALTRRIEGHFNYFGVSWNLSSLKALLAAVPRVWGRWLRRRGQRNPIAWKRFWLLLRSNPLPRPSIRVRIW